MTNAVIRDKRGRQYRIDIDETDFSVEDAEGRIGKAHCEDTGAGRWRLLDIEIFDKVPVPQSRPVVLMRQMLNLGPKTKTYRQLGLGDALLDFIVAHARQHGAKTIRGSIVPHDLENRPWLLQFYEGHEFKRVEWEQGDISEVVVQIEL